MSEGGGLEEPKIIQAAGEKGDGGLWLWVQGVRSEKEAQGSKQGRPHGGLSPTHPGVQELPILDGRHAWKFRLIIGGSGSLLLHKGFL